MRATIQERVETIDGRQIEITDIILETCDPVEQQRLGMIKVRAIHYPVHLIRAPQPGNAIVRLIRPVKGEQLMKPLIGE